MHFRTAHFFQRVLQVCGETTIEVPFPCLAGSQLGTTLNNLSKNSSNVFFKVTSLITGFVDTLHKSDFGYCNNSHDFRLTSRRPVMSDSTARLAETIFASIDCVAVSMLFTSFAK